LLHLATTMNAASSVSLMSASAALMAVRSVSMEPSAMKIDWMDCGSDFASRADAGVERFDTRIWRLI
jgi:hypothetical protein